MRRGEYRPLSDFNFDFKVKVLSDNPASTGYIVSVKQEPLTGEEEEIERLQLQIMHHNYTKSS